MKKNFFRAIRWGEKKGKTQGEMKIKQVDSWAKAKTKSQEGKSGDGKKVRMLLLYNRSPTLSIRCESCINCYRDINVHKILAFIWKANLLASLFPFPPRTSDSTQKRRGKRQRVSFSSFSHHSDGPGRRRREKKKKRKKSENLDEKFTNKRRKVEPSRRVVITFAYLKAFLFCV